MALSLSVFRGFVRQTLRSSSRSKPCSLPNPARGFAYQRGNAVADVIEEPRDEEMSVRDMNEIYRKDRLALQMRLDSMQIQLGSMQSKVDKNSKFISGFGIPYMDILAGEILCWVSGCHRELLPGEVSQHKTTSSTVYKFFRQSPSSQVFAAEVMRVPFEPDFMDQITTVLEARHGAAHWKTITSLEAAVSNGEDLIATYPDAFGKEQVFIVTHFNDLRKVFGKI